MAMIFPPKTIFVTVAFVFSAQDRDPFRGKAAAGNIWRGLWPILRNSAPPALDGIGLDYFAWYPTRLSTGCVKRRPPVNQLVNAISLCVWHSGWVRFFVSSVNIFKSFSLWTQPIPLRGIKQVDLSSPLIELYDKHMKTTHWTNRNMSDTHVSTKFHRQQIVIWNND